MSDAQALRMPCCTHPRYRRAAACANDAATAPDHPSPRRTDDHDHQPYGPGLRRMPSPVPGRPAVTGERSIRRAMAGTVLLVATIAAIVSFVHIEHLAVAHGQTRLAALLLPLSIDGTVAAASLVMLQAARSGVATPWLARFMLALAVAATLAANVGYGLPFGLPGALISGWPAVAFVGSVEMVLSMVRRARRGAPATAPEGAPAPALGR